MQNLPEILIQRGAFAGIEHSVIGEVRRSLGLVCRDQANEFLLGHWLQRIIQAPLLSERRDSVGGKLLAAERAGAVGWIDEDLVGQRQQFVMK